MQSAVRAVALNLTAIALCRGGRAAGGWARGSGRGVRGAAAVRDLRRGRRGGAVRGAPVRAPLLLLLPARQHAGRRAVWLPALRRAHRGHAALAPGGLLGARRLMAVLLSIVLLLTMPACQHAGVRFCCPRCGARIEAMQRWRPGI